MERLEKALMWERYSEQREKLLRLVRGHGRTRGSLIPVEKLQGSTGPVKTTQNLSRGSPLLREIYPEVSNQTHTYTNIDQEINEYLKQKNKQVNHTLKYTKISQTCKK